MKKLHMFLSVLLCVTMIFSMSAYALATEGQVVIDDIEIIEEVTCTCGVAEGEAHLEGCDLYVAPAEPVTPVCTCEIAEGEAHLEGCVMYAESEETEITSDSIPVEDSVIEVICEEGVTIQAVGKIPSDVTLSAEFMPVRQTFRMRSTQTEEPRLLFAYDITFTDQNGIEWQPAAGETVSITMDAATLGLEDGNLINVQHEHNDELNDLGKYYVENGKLTFDTDGFSVFYFYLVFQYNGYEFTLSGGSDVYISELLAALNIGRTADEVTNIFFSDDTLLEISQEGSDWILKSLEPFGSDEYLTIMFNDGETIEIKVTDPVIYNYAIGSDITNQPKLETVNVTVGTVTNGDDYAQGKKYVANKNQITYQEIEDIGTETKSESTQLIVYAKEGMAIRFQAGTDWLEEGSKPKHGTNGVWYWSWDGTYNYAVIDEGAAGKQATFVVTTDDGKTKKKNYCTITLCVVEKSNPVLLEEALKTSGLQGYSLKNVPVTLYNYDGKAFNEHYNKNSGNYFAFSGTSKGISSITNAGNRGWTDSGLQANGGGSVALMGIVKENLVNGLPEMSQGQKVDVFSTATVPGKTVYSNVGFQFVYNENTGYYTYNSALNHAQYDSSTNQILLYDQTLAPSDTPTGASHGNAGFYPFEDINKAYTNTGYTDITWDEWATKLEKNAFELIPSEYSTDIVTTSSTSPASTVDMHYGIQFDSDFYLPKDKKLNGHEMIYEFTGDDDLWVFIDGKLVLDIGGGHTYVSGSFNLTTGEVWVEQYTKLAAEDGGYYETREQGTDLRYKDEYLVNLKDDQMHRIQVFYLERHGGVSNCRMRFNLPLIPSNSVNVSKNVVDQAGGTLSVTPEVDYTFVLHTAADDDDNVDATNFNVLKKYPYTVTGSNAPTGIRYTDEETGQFTLKAGQVASFEGIARFTEVYAVEVKPNDGYSYNKTTVAVNKGTPVDYKCGNKTETKIMQLATSINFDFVNYMNAKPLKIVKNVVGGTSGLLNKNQEFTLGLDFTKGILEKTYGAIYAVKGDESVSLTDDGTFTLKHGESITIPSVPVNMEFAVYESNPDTANGSFDKPVFGLYGASATYDFGAKVNGKIEDSDTNTVTITNQQRFTVTITKNIAGGQNPDQSFIFYLKGEEGTQTEGITATVVIPLEDFVNGTASKAVAHLPVGEYTVTEDGDWSWRYDNVSDQNLSNKSLLATFTNKRIENKWFDGSSHAQNIWYLGKIAPFGDVILNEKE